MVDTQHFNSQFTERLLEAVGDVEVQIDGVLIHSDNLQALNAIHKKYKGQLQSIYIDPPYNVPGAEIAYKNMFPHFKLAVAYQ